MIDLNTPLIYRTELIYCSYDKTVYTVEGLIQLILQKKGVTHYSAKSPLFEFVNWKRWINIQKESYVIFDASKEFLSLGKRFADELGVSSYFINEELSIEDIKNNKVRISIPKKISNVGFDYFNDLFYKLATDPIKDSFYLSDVSWNDNKTYLNFDANEDNIEYCFDNENE